VANIFRFKLYSTFKSTALIIPIFPVFLSETQNLGAKDIIFYSSFFYILPFILEVPTGILSDFIGHKKVTAMGIAVFLCAFLSLLAPIDQPYICYLFLITLAGTLLSGSEGALLYNISNNQNIQHIKIEIDSFFYKSTTFLILLSASLYRLNPFLPIIIQSVMLFIALLIIVNIKETSIKKPISKTNLKFFNNVSIRQYILPFLVLSSLFAFCINLNSRTVQLQLYDSGSQLDIYLISIFFVIGNLVSSWSIATYKKHIEIASNTGLMIILLCGCFSIAFLFMSSSDTFSVGIGFLLLCGVKPIYRTYIYSVYVDLQEKECCMASNLSIYELISSILITVLSFTYANTFISFQQSNTFMAIVLMATGLIFGLYFFKNTIGYQEIKFKSALSNKRHYIKRHETQLSFVQRYPSTDAINQHIIHNRLSPYQTPKLISVSDSEVEWEFIKGSRLSDLSKQEQLGYVHTICKLQKHIIQSGSKQRMIHNDLHPHNILVSNGEYYVIDWDLCVFDSIEQDVYCLLTSPYLRLDHQERMKLIADTLGITSVEAINTARQFIENKVQHLKSFSDTDFIRSLVQQYLGLLHAYHR
jgi:hypothetical protein